MGARDDQLLIEKLKSLSPQRRAEVEDFVDFLKSREGRQRLTHAAAHTYEEAARRQAGKKLLDAMQRLREANVPPLTEEDIAEEVKAARAARKGPQSR